jgi:D-glycero-D-manno-heptose 1,7-bisphosphate phosphatase
MRNRAVFFDRDDTLNYDPGYLSDPHKVKLYPFVPEGIANLKNQHQFKIIVVSNQSGITRGLVSAKVVDEIHQEINSQLQKCNTSIDAFYYCPYHPDFDPPEKVICRKPSPYMIVKAAEQYNIDLNISYMVGDKASDIECGLAAGTKTVLVNYNNSSSAINTLKKADKSPNFTSSNFSDVCDYIISDYLGELN